MSMPRYLFTHRFMRLSIPLWAILCAFIIGVAIWGQQDMVYARTIIGGEAHPVWGWSVIVEDNDTGVQWRTWWEDEWIYSDGHCQLGVVAPTGTTMTLQTRHMGNGQAYSIELGEQAIIFDNVYWSPDGDYIALTHSAFRTEEDRLIIIHLPTQRQYDLSEHTRRSTGFAWSPNRNQAIIKTDSNADTRILLISFEDSEVAVETVTGDMLLDPNRLVWFWAVDGMQLIAMSGQGGTFIIDLETGITNQVTELPTELMRPTASQHRIVADEPFAQCES